MRYVDRDEFILQFCRGRRVLHLGCIGLTNLPIAERIERYPETLHCRLSRIAQAVGVDKASDAAARLRACGLADNIIVGDVQKLEDIDSLKPEFDVILAADIIEHVSNPGKMLDGIRRLCRPNTEVLLTTPNAFGLLNFLRYLVHRFREGEDHVLTFNFSNLSNLLERHGFKRLEMGTCHQRSIRLPPGIVRLGRFLLGRMPRMGGTIFVQAVPRPTRRDPNL